MKFMINAAVYLAVDMTITGIIHTTRNFFERLTYYEKEKCTQE